MSSIILQPKVAVSIVPATVAVENSIHKILFIGQKVAAGTAVAGALNENILNDNSEDTLFGANSMLAGMIREAIVAAVNADLDCPVTASNLAGTVTFTADNKGTVGNKIGLEVVGSVAGVATVVTGMLSGATDPTLTTVCDVVGTQRYQTIVWPYAAATTVLLSFLGARFNDDSRVLDGVGITATEDTPANHLIPLDAINSQNLVMLTDETQIETLYKGPAMFEMEQIKASQFAAIRGLRLTG